MNAMIKLTARVLAIALMLILPGAVFAYGPPAAYIVPSIAAMQAIGGPAQYPYIQVQGYNAGTNIGGGLFVWNASSTATNDSCTIFSVSGVGTGRYVRQLQGQPLNVQQCGAYGDGSHMDTTAINAGLDYITATSNQTNSGTLNFPCGQFNIDAALTPERVSAAYGFTIAGENVLCSRIIQTVANTPIFKFANSAGAHSFQIHDLFLTATPGLNTVAGSSTSAVAILFNTNNSTSFYNFSVSNVQCDYLYRCISDEIGSSSGNGARVWGADFRNMVQNIHMLGAFFYEDSGAGEPRISFHQININSGVGGSTPAWSEPFFFVNSSDSVSLDQIEILSTTCTSAGQPCWIDTASSAYTIDNLRGEQVTLATGTNLILIAANRVQVRNFSVSLKSQPPDATTEFVFYLAGSSDTNKAYLNIDGIQLANVFPTAGGHTGYLATYAASTIYNVVGRLNGFWNPAVAGGYTNYVNQFPAASSGSYILPIEDTDGQTANTVCLLYDDGTCFSHGGNKLVGTAGSNATVTLAWPLQRRYAITSTFVQNETINLPTPPASIQNAPVSAETSIIRYNATPGNFTMAVTGSGNTLTSTINKNASVTFDYNLANSAIGWIALNQAAAFQ